MQRNGPQGIEHQVRGDNRYQTGVNGVQETAEKHTVEESFQTESGKFLEIGPHWPLASLTTFCAYHKVCGTPVGWVWCPAKVSRYTGQERGQIILSFVVKV
ncbi:hypothetical protein ATANTOWER_023973 [Ataeniobius toweri]|uniref:Uncharacterized protein n=1 Tax=Ataeniobius toweri TaxID=208326 RepID=A0ABU7BA14_9TELE|nr:hypothetical protein [Ataeniobius toweri]